MQKKNTSSIYRLSRLKAIKVFFSFHEWMHCRCVCGCTVRPPLLVFLFVLGTSAQTQRIDNETIKRRNLVNPLQIHTTLSEDILTPWLILHDFFDDPYNSRSPCSRQGLPTLLLC